MTSDSLSTLEERGERDESVSVHLAPSPPRSSPEPRHLRLSSSPTLSSLHDVVDPLLPSFGGKYLSDARSALAKVLTSSVSRGALLRRLKNSAALPKSANGSMLTPETNWCFHDGGVSVPSSGLATQPEWEEPVHRVSMTTFKVVPSEPTGPELGPVVLDQTEVEDEPAVEVDGQSQVEEEPLCSPSLEACSLEDPGSDRRPSLPPSPDSESQVCPESPPTEEEEDEVEVIPAESSECDDVEAGEQIDSAEQRDVPKSPTPSGSTDVDLGGPNAAETDAEAEVLQDEAGDSEVDEEVEEDAFPPPPSPVFFTEDTNILEEVEDVPQASCLPSSPQTSCPTSTGPDGALGEDLQMAPQLPEPAPESSEKTDAAPSRFAEAVAMAVQKSRLQRQGKVLSPQASSGPPSDLPAPFYV